MAIETKITRKLDNNCVQVEVNGKNMPTRFFKVPEDKADEFCVSYRKNDHGNSLIANTALITSVLGGSFLGSILTGKVFKFEKISRLTGGTIMACLAGFSSVFLIRNIIGNRNQQVLAKYNAEKLDYKNKENVIK